MRFSRKRQDVEPVAQDADQADGGVTDVNAVEDAWDEAEVDDAGTPGASSAISALEQRIAELEAEAVQWKDRCFRTAADAENVRRRSQRELEDGRKYANERLVSDLLPVMDNLIRAQEASAQTSNVEALKTGVEQTERLFSEALSRAGLTRIEAVGQPFDPNQHEAIMQVPAEEGQGANEVVEELRAGYRLHDRVVRPSLVKVTVS